MTTRPPIEARPVVGETTMVLPWTVERQAVRQRILVQLHAEDARQLLGRDHLAAGDGRRRHRPPAVGADDRPQRLRGAGRRRAGCWPRPVTTAAAASAAASTRALRTRRDTRKGTGAYDTAQRLLACGRPAHNRPWAALRPGTRCRAPRRGGRSARAAHIGAWTPDAVRVRFPRSRVRVNAGGWCAFARTRTAQRAPKAHAHRVTPRVLNPTGDAGGSPQRDPATRATACLHGCDAGHAGVAVPPAVSARGRTLLAGRDCRVRVGDAGTDAVRLARQPGALLRTDQLATARSGSRRLGR